MLDLDYELAQICFASQVTTPTKSQRKASKIGRHDIFVTYFAGNEYQSISPSSPKIRSFRQEEEVLPSSPKRFQAAVKEAKSHLESGKGFVVRETS